MGKQSLGETIDKLSYPAEAIIGLSEEDYLFSIPDKKTFTKILRKVEDLDLAIVEEEKWVMTLLVRRLEESEELVSVPVIIEFSRVTIAGEVFQHDKGLEIKEPEYTFTDLEKTALRGIRHILEAVNSIRAPQSWLRNLKPNLLIYTSEQLVITRSSDKIFGKDTVCYFAANILFNGRTLLYSEVIGLSSDELVKLINEELVNFTGSIGPWQSAVVEAEAVEKFRLIDLLEVKTIAGKLGLVTEQ